MPKIREYFSQAAQRGLDVSPLVRLAGSQEETGNAKARAIRQQYDGFGEGVAQLGLKIEQHNEQDDTSKLTAASATAQADMNVAWEEYVKQADPNDPELAQKFLDTIVNPTIEKMGEGLASRKGEEMFTVLSAKIKADFYQKTHTDASTLRGGAAVDNFMTFRNKMSTALAKDPTGFRTAVSLLDTVAENYQRSFGVDPVKVMQLKRETSREFALSSVQAMARTNPTAARQALASGQFDAYIDGTDASTLTNRIDQEETAAKNEAKSAETEVIREYKMAADADLSALSASLIKEDGTVGVPEGYFQGILDIQQKYKDKPGALTAGELNAARNAATAILNREARGIPVITDSQMYEDFRQRSSLPMDDPKRLGLEDVYNAKADGKLSDKDFRFFSGWINAEGRDPVKRAALKEFNKSATSLKGYITKSSFMKVDALGDDRWREYSSEVQQRFMDGLAEGKTAKTMLDKTNADYVFFDLAGAQLGKKELREGIRQQARGAVQPLGPRGAPAARQPNETPADYLKRLKGQ